MSWCVDVCVCCVVLCRVELNCGVEFALSVRFVLMFLLFVLVLLL